MFSRVFLTLIAASVCVSALDAGGKADAIAPAQLDYFEKRIRPLFVNHCYRCHSADAKKPRGGLLLDTREGLRKGGASGAAIVPGKPQEGLLVKLVRHPDKEERMPPGKTLSAEEIAALEMWIRLGAPDPRVAGAPQKSVVNIDEGKKFWSLQPLQAISLPNVKNATWPAHAIDRFILTKLEQQGLKPVGGADRRTLLRRATYDLTGLPPTPEEIDAFLGDKVPDAFAKVVDRLLASKGYGERWGRHWLDVVRYADTAGDNSDYPIPQMGLYRDWVIDAIQRDMPYDQFVREQLAGDLMPAKSDAQRRAKVIATGYLANTHRFGSYEDARYPWHLTIEDTIDNFGKTFLGLSVHCCRCHDHKFDPLLAEDYYGLYGFFSSTRYPWPGIELDRMQRDLIPLASSAEIDKAKKERQQQLAKLDAAIKQMQESKAPADKIKAARNDRDRLAKLKLPVEQAYAVMDGKNEPKKRIGQIGDVKVHIKGDPDRPGKEVPRRFPLVLGGQQLSPDVKGSGRLELARWLTDPGNPLFARVIVNRVWHYHFGRGIVATPNDFGNQGQRPTHPELLDYLAREFIADGWSLKRLHRRIMLSRTYQLASAADEANLKADPGDVYLWRFPPRRLDAESIRDTLLFVSGQLDRTSAPPHPFPDEKTWNFTQHRPFKAVYDTNRRSVYLMTQRIQRHPFLALFDGPDTNASTATRVSTTTPLQALFLMNGPFVHEQASRFAARIRAEAATDDTRIERAFVRLFARTPSAAEKKQALDYLHQMTVRLRDAGVAAEQRPVRAWESLARALFMSNELVYVN